METYEADFSILVRRTQEYIVLEKKYQELKKKYEGKCRKRKNFFKMSSIQKRRYKNQILINLSHTQEICKNSGLKLSSLVLTPTFDDNEKTKIIVKTESQENLLDKAVLCKDIKNISDDCYQSLISFLGQDLPSLNQIKVRQKEIDLRVKIERNNKGLFVCLESKLREVLLNNISKMQIIDQTIHVCYHGDSTVIYRDNTKLLVITFSIINEGVKATTAYGTYMIGCFEIENENYDQVYTSVQELKNQMEHLNTIKVNETDFKLEKYFSADWKFLQICIGIKSANSMHPCLYCKYVKGTTSIKSLKTDCWTMNPPSQHYIETNNAIAFQKNSARTLNEAQQIINRNEKNNYGYINLGKVKLLLNLLIAQLD